MLRITLFYCDTKALIGGRISDNQGEVETSARCFSPYRVTSALHDARRAAWLVGYATAKAHIPSADKLGLTISSPRLGFLPKSCPVRCHPSRWILGGKAKYCRRLLQIYQMISVGNHPTRQPSDLTDGGRSIATNRAVVFLLCSSPSHDYFPGLEHRLPCLSSLFDLRSTGAAGECLRRHCIAAPGPPGDWKHRQKASATASMATQHGVKHRRRSIAALVVLHCNPDGDSTTPMRFIAASTTLHCSPGRA